MWSPARVVTGPSFRGVELGEILLPVLTPFACDDENDDVRLGRVTEWGQLESGDVIPLGQKVVVADEEEIALLDIRELIIQPAASEPS